MPEFLGLRISLGRLVLRGVLAFIAAFFTFALLYLIPLDIAELAGMGAPPQLQPQVAQIVAGIIHPALPALGLALTPAVFLAVLLRGSRVYGPLVIVESALSFAYVFFAFQGGTFTIDIPQSLISSISALPLGIQLSIFLQVNLAFIMILFLVPCALGIAKGALLTLRKRS